MKRWSDKEVSQDSLASKRDAKGKSWVKGGTNQFVSYLKMDEVKTYLPKTGRNEIRIVPPLEKDEMDFYGLEVHFHRNVGDKDVEGFGDYLCVKKMARVFKEFRLNDIYPKIESAKCFMCDQQTEELWNTDRDLAKSFYPAERVLMWVLDLKSETPDEVLLWSCPKSLCEEIINQSENTRTGEVLDVSSTKRGCPVYFKKTQSNPKDFRTIEYGGVQVAFSEPMPLENSICDQLVYFGDLLVIPEYDTVKAAYNGTMSGNPAAQYEDKEDDIPKTWTRKKKDAEEAVEEAPSESCTEVEEPISEDSPQDMYSLDCLGVNYDEYEDCETCPEAEECKRITEEKKKPAKPSRPSRPVSQPVKQEEPSSEEDKRAALRAKIAARKAQ